MELGRGCAASHLHIDAPLEEEAQAKEAANGQPQQGQPRPEEGVRLPRRHARKAGPRAAGKGKQRSNVSPAVQVAAGAVAAAAQPQQAAPRASRRATQRVQQTLELGKGCCAQASTKGESREWLTSRGRIGPSVCVGTADWNSLTLGTFYRISRPRRGLAGRSEHLLLHAAACTESAISLAGNRF